jgi:hypothetical protein
MIDIDNDEPVMVEPPEGNCQEWRRPSDNKLHRVGEPALIWSDGTLVWFQNGELHREDGPAYVENGRDVEFHLFGQRVSPQEHREWREQQLVEQEARRQETLRQLLEACEEATVLKTSLNIGRPLRLQARPVLS